jgi:UDP-3-O-[3-hydroxymyristoyl] glucosamine N-acyltransferase
MTVEENGRLIVKRPNKFQTDYRPQFIKGGNNMSNGGQNVISPDFICGDHFKIGSFCVIEEGVTAGDNVTIGNLCVIKKGSWIKSNTDIEDHEIVRGKL